MTKEEKQILLKDLCPRLPYGYISCKWIVKSFNPDTFDEELEINEARIAFIEPNTNSVHLCGKEIPVDIGEVKPYLRPMSSMTDEEKIELKTITKGVIQTVGLEDIVVTTDKGFDWLNKKGFDYRGLIPMGLALEAPKDMYKTESLWK